MLSEIVAPPPGSKARATTQWARLLSWAVRQAMCSCSTTQVKAAVIPHCRGTSRCAAATPVLWPGLRSDWGASPGRVRGPVDAMETSEGGTAEMTQARRDSMCRCSLPGAHATAALRSLKLPCAAGSDVARRARHRRPAVQQHGESSVGRPQPGWIAGLRRRWTSGRPRAALALGRMRHAKSPRTTKA